MGIFDRFKSTAPQQLTNKDAYLEWTSLFQSLNRADKDDPVAQNIAKKFLRDVDNEIHDDEPDRKRSSMKLQQQDFVALAKIYQGNNSKVQAVVLNVMKELRVPRAVLKDFQNESFDMYRSSQAENKFKVYEGIGPDGKDTLITNYETEAYRDKQNKLQVIDPETEPLYNKFMENTPHDTLSCIARIQRFEDRIDMDPNHIIDDDVDLSNFKLIADNEKIYPQNMSTKGCQLFEREYTNEPEAPIPNIGAVYAKILEKVNGKEFSSRTNEVAKIDNKIAQMKFNLDEDLNNNKSIVFNKIRYANDAMVVGEDGHGKYAKVNLDNGDLSTQMYRNSGDPAAVITGKLTSESLAQLKAMVEKRIQVEYGAPVNEDQEIASPIPKAAKQNKAEQNISSRPEGLSSLIKDAAEEKDNEPAPSVQSQDSHDVR